MKVQRLASAFMRRVAVPLTPPHKRLSVLAWTDRNINRIEEPELRQLHCIVPAGCRTAVDAGANQGLYSHRLASLSRTVFAFEINPQVTGNLQRARLANLNLVHMGLSNCSREVILYIPLLNGTLPLVGWASLQPGNCPGVDVHQEVPARVCPLDDYALPEVDFLKIDVEGHELQVLQGAKETIARYRPRILAEVRDLPGVAAFLSQFGYRSRRPEAFGVRGSPEWMHVFDKE
jgi:FkbM family methyltransferase